MDACKNWILREEEKRKRIRTGGDYISEPSTGTELVVVVVKREVVEREGTACSCHPKEQILCADTTAEI